MNAAEAERILQISVIRRRRDNVGFPLRRRWDHWGVNSDGYTAVSSWNILSIYFYSFSASVLSLREGSWEIWRGSRINLMEVCIALTQLLQESEMHRSHQGCHGHRAGIHGKCFLNVTKSFVDKLWFFFPLVIEAAHGVHLVVFFFSFLFAGGDFKRTNVSIETFVNKNDSLELFCYLIRFFLFFNVLYIAYSHHSCVTLKHDGVKG